MDYKAAHLLNNSCTIPVWGTNSQHVIQGGLATKCLMIFQSKDIRQNNSVELKAERDLVAKGGYLWVSWVSLS